MTKKREQVQCSEACSAHMPAAAANYRLSTCQLGTSHAITPGERIYNHSISYKLEDKLENPGNLAVF